MSDGVLLSPERESAKIARRWQVDAEFCYVMNAIENVANRYGYFAAVYGSVVTKGASYKDLDVLLVPYVAVGPSRYAVCIDRICEALGAERVGKPYAGQMGTHAELLRLPGGRLIDLQVREVRS